MNKALKEAFSGIKAPKRNQYFETLSAIFPLVPIRNKEHHAGALGVLEKAITFNNDETLATAIREGVNNYIEVLATLIEEYEKKHFHVDKPSGRDMLEFFMGQHGLKQTDLAKELGGQPIVSSILNSERELNLRQIKALAKRFGVSPAVFIGK